MLYLGVGRGSVVNSVGFVINFCVSRFSFILIIVAYLLKVTYFRQHEIDLTVISGECIEDVQVYTFRPLIISQ
jgi:hypothetical protein